MAIIKCKMCGGDLNLVEGQSVAECEYCGSRQTVPVADDEKKLTLFARANRLRVACEFDKAAGIYEAIVADFPEEAEAYWGLVLCKYGIEYVDDPATGKKIPTCHRSSFDSVMDDSNFEQAMENADEVALRVYRQEAKQIEGIRKGILEVSSSEQPYDIFICYKETDENGDRTVDSLLAQDIYDALTSKGYRVFFSRITLEDKLGQAYEPYIFAALNSAKIMLAVGTCYEHYNAVWVKNEWSRYLKIIAQDKNKYLIPCYKNIDAYDIPKEFAHLQGQDMGKVGAIADLLRGVEKLLPRKENGTTVMQGRVIPDSGGSQKITALLERGYMALEDEDWEQADRFFEEVLNNDAKNPYSYLGKALLAEKCTSMADFLEKRKSKYSDPKPTTVKLRPEGVYIAKVSAQYAIPGYLDTRTIRQLYDFEFSYCSTGETLKQQYRQEESWWANHRLLSRAEKFASGETAKQFQSEKALLFDWLRDRILRGEAEEASAAAEARNAYEERMAAADVQAAQLYEEAVRARDAQLAKTEREQAQRYQQLVTGMHEAKTPGQLRELVRAFDKMGDYSDSRVYAGQCRETAAELQRKQPEKPGKRPKKRNGAAVVALVLVLTLAAGLSVFLSRPQGKYFAAVALMETANYESAAAILEEIGEYKDSGYRLRECRYFTAVSLADAGNYAEALECFEALGPFKDSAQYISECQYNVAVSLENAENYVQACRLFEALGDYKDSKLKLNKCYKFAAAQLETLGNTSQAAIYWYKAGDREKCVQLWDAVAHRDTISVGINHTVALKNDGTVVAVGLNYGWDDTMVFRNGGPCDVYGWRAIVAVAAGGMHTVGLKKNGTVVAVGLNTSGQCSVGGWTDIVSIAAGDDFTLGLRADGTVVFTGGWSGRSIEVVRFWTDIIAIVCDDDTAFGLKSDGTVVSTAKINLPQNWGNVVSIDTGVSEAGQRYIIGVTTDGAVVTGGGRVGMETQWKNIVDVAVDGRLAVGVRGDGTVITFGSFYRMNATEICEWSDIVAVCISPNHAVGLRADGTVVATGNNNEGQCNVSGWTNIKLPN